MAAREMFRVPLTIEEIDCIVKRFEADIAALEVARNVEVLKKMKLQLFKASEGIKRSDYIASNVNADKKPTAKNLGFDDAVEVEGFDEAGFLAEMEALQKQV